MTLVDSAKRRRLFAFKKVTYQAKSCAEMSAYRLVTRALNTVVACSEVLAVGREEIVACQEVMVACSEMTVVRDGESDLPR